MSMNQVRGDGRVAEAAGPAMKKRKVPTGHDLAATWKPSARSPRPSTAPAPASTPAPRTTCPICGQPADQVQVNDHLDWGCPTPGSENQEPGIPSRARDSRPPAANLAPNSLSTPPSSGRVASLKSNAHCLPTAQGPRIKSEPGTGHAISSTFPPPAKLAPNSLPTPPELNGFDSSLKAEASPFQIAHEPRIKSEPSIGRASVSTRASHAPNPLSTPPKSNGDDPRQQADAFSFQPTQEPRIKPEPGNGHEPSTTRSHTADVAPKPLSTPPSSGRAANPQTNAYRLPYSQDPRIKSDPDKRHACATQTAKSTLPSLKARIGNAAPEVVVPAIPTLMSNTNNPAPVPPRPGTGKLPPVQSTLHSFLDLRNRCPPQYFYLSQTPASGTQPASYSADFVEKPPGGSAGFTFAVLLNWVYGTIICCTRIDLTGVGDAPHLGWKPSKHPIGPDPEILIPLLKSHLQKTVRRCQVSRAHATAGSLLSFPRGAEALYRRLPIIAAEDAEILDGLPVIVWLMLAERWRNNPGRPPVVWPGAPPQLAAWVARFAGAVAASGKDVLIRSWPGTKRGLDLTRQDVADLPSAKDRTLLYALGLRISYGGSSHDMMLLYHAQLVWKSRFAQGWTLPPWPACSPPALASLPKAMNKKSTVLCLDRDEWTTEAMDDHVLPVTARLASDLRPLLEEHNVSLDELSSLFWVKSSGLSTKVAVKYGKMGRRESATDVTPSTANAQLGSLWPEHIAPALKAVQLHKLAIYLYPFYQ